MKIGFIGLGKMGRGMAARLAGAGHELTVWNRTASSISSFVAENSARQADSPRAAAEAADLVWTMLADPRAVNEVVKGPQGLFAGARRGQIWIDSSTIDPASSRDLAASAATHGLRMLDAPVLGSVPEAAKGTLLMIVGGDRADLEAVRPAVDVVAHKVFYMGGHGQGEQMKLVLNALLAGFMEVTAEALNLGIKGGISQEGLQQVIAETHMASPWLKGKLTRTFDPQGAVNFTLPMMLKDLRLISENAARVNADIPTLDTTREEYEKAAGTEFARRDYTDIYEFIKTGGGGNR